MKIDFEKLRAAKRSDKQLREQRVITVRLTPRLHELLRIKAHREHVSLNQLCVAALEIQLPQDPHELAAMVAGVNPETGARAAS